MTFRARTLLLLAITLATNVIGLGCDRANYGAYLFTSLGWLGLIVVDHEWTTGRIMIKGMRWVQRAEEPERFRRKFVHECMAWILWMAFCTSVIVMSHLWG